MHRKISRTERLKLKKAIFLDRDGVINKVILSDGKPFSPRKFNEFEFLPQVEKALSYLRKLGFINIIVTNQPDIARGLVEMKELNKMHTLIREKLPVDDLMVCPHDDKDNCTCRKPKPGMLIEASEKWGIELKKSYLIGDSWKDMEAGKSVSCKTILIDMPYNHEAKSEYRVKNWDEVVETIDNCELEIAHEEK